MLRPFKTRLTPGVAVGIAVLAVAVVASIVSRDGGGDVATDTGETGTAPVRSTAVVVTDAGEATSGDATPVLRPTAVVPDPPAPAAKPTPAATATPTPTVRHDPTPTATPAPTSTPTPTPVPTATPASTSTPTPTPTPHPPVSGHCFHCWVYAYPPIPALNDVPAFTRTEEHLLERFSLDAERVGVCDACAWVFDPRAPLTHSVFVPVDAPDGEGGIVRIRGLSPKARVVLKAMAEGDHSTEEGGPWLTTITPDLHPRDVGGMITYPVLPYPRPDHGHLALTHSGYRELVRRVPTADVEAERPQPPALPGPEWPEWWPEGWPTCMDCDPVDLPPTVWVANTGGDGVAVRDDCVDSARVGNLVYEEASRLELFATGTGRCAGWSYVGGSPTWVRNRYLSDEAPVIPLRMEVPAERLADLPLASCTLPTRAEVTAWFDAAQLAQAVTEAAALWNTALRDTTHANALTIDAIVYTGTCSTETGGRGGGRNSIVAEHVPGGSAGRTYFSLETTAADSVYETIILINVNVEPGCPLRNVVAHELGHALGLAHGGRHRDLMYPGGDTPPCDIRPSTMEVELLLDTYAD